VSYPAVFFGAGTFDRPANAAPHFQDWNPTKRERPTALRARGPTEINDCGAMMHTTSPNAGARIGRSPINHLEFAMGINKDQVEGRVKEAGGKIQEEFGKVIGNKKQELKGKVKKSVGATQADLGDAAEEAKDAIRKP
jgi:uncharacterized protein YjbJ (UPF0337 family)